MSKQDIYNDIALNLGILDTSIAPSNERETTSVQIQAIPHINYDARYFETIPTVWANAYAFERLLYQNDPSAIEEWACLFLLHYYGVIGISRLSAGQAQTNFEPRLWMALSGTYPSMEIEPLDYVDMLKTSDNITVGGGFEETIFFPSRGRSTWAESNMLRPFQENKKLSWKRCCDILLRDRAQREAFYNHFIRIAHQRLEGALRQTLINFCNQATVFNGLTLRNTSGLTALSKDPTQWVLGYDPDPQRLLAAYPLRKSNAKGGYTYYLVQDMPILSDWMNAALPGKPTPLQYSSSADSDAIIVSLAGRSIVCQLNEHDEVQMLGSLFLNEVRDFTYFSRTPKTEVNMLRRFHSQLVRESKGIFADLNVDDRAICMAPVRSKFLEHFPELLQDPDPYISTTVINPGDGVRAIEWRFKLRGEQDTLEVIWHSTPNYSKDFFVTSLSIWPPQLSEDWNYYVLFAKGQDTQTQSKWNLMDEHGRLGHFETLGKDSYLTLLQGEDSSRRPRAMYLKDEDIERGVLFLSALPGKQIQTTDTATLSIDFGTSNTCLAYRYTGVATRPHRDDLVHFSLSPLPIWEMGEQPDLPGFVPTRWGGEKGFFPTALLKREGASLPSLPSEIAARHLFHVDIPSLHSKDVVDAWAQGDFSDWTTFAEAELKWNHGENEPWRSLFLTLVILYAQAELFFKEGLVVNEYRCTFPLSFSEAQWRGFSSNTRTALDRVREISYSNRVRMVPAQYQFNINESIAIAKFTDADANSTALDIFIDVGGGTTDIAVRYKNDFLVLDSLRMAGRTFFQFSERNYDLPSLPGSSEFKKYLYMLLTGTHAIGQEWNKNSMSRFDLATQYSISINKVEDSHIETVEGRILDEKMGEKSFQRYRSQLFFNHLLAYALLQGCAAAMNLEQKQKEKLTGFHLILGGNAWGLLMFAEFSRSQEFLQKEAEKKLSMLKEVLSHHVEEKDREYLKKLKVTRIDLLNEVRLRDAKTAAALGALKIDGQPQRIVDTFIPYTGITISKLRVNGDDPEITISWKDRWSKETLNHLTGLDAQIIDSLDIAEPPNSSSQPIDSVLSIFSRLGNPAKPHEDPLPEEQWESINATLLEGQYYLAFDDLKYSPIQLLLTKVLYPEREVHARLEKLAEITGHYKQKA